MLATALQPRQRWLSVFGLALFFGYLLFNSHFYWQGYQLVEAGKEPRFTDYTSTYAASLLLQREPAANLYVTERMFAAEVDAAHAVYPGQLTQQQAEGHGFARWLYPPIFALFCLPLALLPYIPSLVAWLSITAIPYIATLILTLPKRSGLILVLAAPPTFYNIQYGQTGFLSAGLIGLGLTLLRSQPTLAGVLIGCAAFKPSLGILIPIALAAGGYWWSFTTATSVVISLIAASIIAFGLDPWLAFIGTSGYSFDGFGRNLYNFKAMVTPLGASRMLGASINTAWIIQSLAALLSVIAVIWAWRQPAEGRSGLQASVLCCASLLFTPMAYLYDMALIVPAAGWLLADMLQRDYRRYELTGLILAMAIILPMFEIAHQTGVQLGPLPAMILMLLSLNRLKRFSPSAASNSQPRS
ncbi:MAG: glycosyltransferase family 87 protein [Halopseudomonas sp.]